MYSMYPFNMYFHYVVHRNNHFWSGKGSFKFDYCISTTIRQKARFIHDVMCNYWYWDVSVRDNKLHDRGLKCDKWWVNKQNSRRLIPFKWYRYPVCGYIRMDSVNVSYIGRYRLPFGVESYHLVVHRYGAITLNFFNWSKTFKWSW